MAAKDPLKAAKAGGRHAGFYVEYAKKSDVEIRRGINSLEKQIGEHERKIRNPEKYVPDFKSLDPREQKALIETKWPGDIARQQQQKSILEGILTERMP